ncbi:MAG: hypothetical protein OEO23_07725 [Gemmatimonadota bacterium]|nr:hypothetical protein [Gemmatimonadota bacterium]
MLENTETLLSLAEVAAAFAGFAALVSVIPRGLGRTSAPAHDILRLRLVIAGGVAGVAAALVPIGLAGYSDADLTWRFSAVAFLVFDNGIILSFVGAYQPVRGTFPPDRLAVVVVTSMEVLEQASLAAVALGIGVAEPAALYVTALILNLCQAAFIFLRFVGSTFQEQGSD